MNIDIKATGLDLTEPLREYIETKIGSLDKFLARFEADSIRVQVEVARISMHHKHGDVFYAEGNLTFPGGSLRATDKSSDIKMSIDKVKDILQREIRKYKDQHS